MADIELIIKIPEEEYERLVYMDVFKLRGYIENGVVLPKGHGRIKDIDKIESYGCTTEFYCPHKDRECKDCDRAECSKTQVDAIACEDCVSREKVWYMITGGKYPNENDEQFIDRLVEGLEKMPLVTPQPKTGH